MMRNVSWVLGSLLAALVISLGLVRYLLPLVSRLVPGPYLETTLESAHADSHEARAVTVGDPGTAVTPLRPSGKIRLGDRLIDAQTRGEFIETDTPIQVTAVEQNHVIVAATKEE